MRQGRPVRQIEPRQLRCTTGPRSNDSDDASVRGGALHRIANLSDHREGESVDPSDRFNRTVAIEPSTSYSMFDASEFMTPCLLDAYLTLTHSESPCPSTTALLAGRGCVLLTIETDSKNDPVFPQRF